MERNFWEYAAQCSNDSLQNMELSRLAAAANLLKSIRADLEQLIAARVEAELLKVLQSSAIELARIANLRQGSFDFEARPKLSGHETAIIRKAINVAGEKRSDAYLYGEPTERSA